MGVLVTILVVATIGLYVLYLVLKQRDRLVDFSEHIFAGVIAVWGVTYVIERPLKRHYRDIQNLSAEQFCREMSCAKRSIHIMDIWMKSFLLSRERKRFEQSVVAAVRDGIEVQILVAHPDCHVARKRAETLSENADDFIGETPEDIVRGMRECIALLAALRERVETMAKGPKARILRNTLQIKIFRSDLGLSMYKVDDISYWNHFHFNKLSLEGEQYVTTSDGGPAIFMSQQFSRLWADAATMTIQDFKAAEMATLA